MFKTDYSHNYLVKPDGRHDEKEFNADRPEWQDSA
jgi:hypothetical protein